MVELVGDEQVAGRVERDGEWRIEARGRGGTAVAGKGARELRDGRPAAGDGGDDAVWAHLPHPLVGPLREVDVACPIQRQEDRTIQASLGGRAPVPGEAFYPGPRRRGDDPGRAHFP